MAIGAVSGALPALPPLPAVDSPARSATARGGAADATKGFADAVAQSIDRLSDAQARADVLARQAATGDLRDIHEYMIAATEASLATELTVAVRNRAVEAFNSIMQMGL